MNVAACLLCSVLAVPQGPGEPSTFENETFSFTCPEGWLIASRETIDEIRRELGNVPQLADMNFERVDAFAFEQVESVAAFSSNVNFVRTQVRVPVSEEGVEEVRKQLTAQLTQMGLEFKKDMVVARGVVAGLPCYRIDYEGVVPTGPDNLRQRQVMVPVGGQLLTITFSATTERFDAVEPLFEEMLRTMKITAPAGFAETWESMPRFLRSAIIGGVCGLVVAFFVTMSKRKRASSSAGPVDPEVS